MDPTTKLRQITRLLRKAYGPRQRERHWDNPLDSLIQTILSQNTTADNCERAYASLRQRFKTWEEVWQASLRDLIAAIRPGGLANIKAVRIKAFLEEVWGQQGHFDLSFLRDLSDEEVQAYLGRFKGISSKTRSCVLLFGLGRAAFPVDTHVFRLCRRLGAAERAGNAREGPGPPGAAGSIPRMPRPASASRRTRPPGLHGTSPLVRSVCPGVSLQLRPASTRRHAGVDRRARIW